MSSAALWGGALLLVAVPFTELVVGLDVMTTVALIAPEWALLLAFVLAAIHLYRRTRRKYD
ncbi:hypothetical protein K7711_00765 [Nocardia sp. CA2R105]|uniref:hypothetical protein n=1 Tax=Nocardia coffeae TaxID=2873381 RepID=UPI001CA70180|nr:hypothetical protein [Nocardia coffeae]MBY8855002.1 hypothetical protein [Nocardia coffeae]